MRGACSGGIQLPSGMRGELFHFAHGITTNVPKVWTRPVGSDTQGVMMATPSDPRISNWTLAKAAMEADSRPISKGKSR